MPRFLEFAQYLSGLFQKMLVFCGEEASAWWVGEKRNYTLTAATTVVNLQPIVEL